MARTSTAIALITALIAAPAMAQTTYQYSDFDSDGDLELTDVEFERYSASVFERYDADADSYLSSDEYTTFDRQVGPFDQQFGTWDADADGRLAAGEFNTGLFNAYDDDRNLSVSENEYGVYDDRFSQVGGLDNTVQSDEIVTLADWRYDDLYNGGVSVEELIDGMDVIGPTGDDIGEVENVLFGPGGRVVALVAEVGGFWDIGDTHISVPWDMVQPGTDNVLIPVTEETVGDYSIFNDNVTYLDAANQIQQVEGDGIGKVETGPRVWRATDLIGDYARVKRGDRFGNYGYVNDLIIRNGQIAATVVSPDSGYGRGGSYAYPYPGYTAGDYYNLPYAEDELGGVEPFEYDRMS